MKIEDLKANQRNPRKSSGEALAGLKVSLARYGDIAGITFNTRTQSLVTGHQRMTALRAIYGDGLRVEGERLVAPTGEGWAIRVVDWDDATANAAMVTANNQNIAGEFTDELQVLLKEIEACDGDLFASLELDKLVEEMGEGMHGVEVDITKLEPGHVLAAAPSPAKEKP